jgi:hypothetical protein
MKKQSSASPVRSLPHKELVTQLRRKDRAQPAQSGAYKQGASYKAQAGCYEEKEISQPQVHTNSEHATQLRQVVVKK